MRPMITKDINPKDAVGTRKVPIFTVIPRRVIAELGIAMLEGARKYGRHNYRVAGVRASVYLDAADRHMSAFWEGQDIDPDSKLSHVTKAIASLTVLRDSMMHGNWVDDRPPACEDFITDMNAKASAVIDKIPEAKEAFIHGNKTESPLQPAAPACGPQRARADEEGYDPLDDFSTNAVFSAG